MCGDVIEVLFLNEKFWFLCFGVFGDLLEKMWVLGVVILGLRNVGLLLGLWELFLFMMLVRLFEIMWIILLLIVIFSDFLVVLVRLVSVKFGVVGSISDGIVWVLFKLFINIGVLLCLLMLWIRIVVVFVVFVFLILVMKLYVLWLISVIVLLNVFVVNVL